MSYCGCIKTVQSPVNLTCSGKGSEVKPRVIIILSAFPSPLPEACQPSCFVDHNYWLSSASSHWSPSISRAAYLLTELNLGVGLSSYFFGSGAALESLSLRGSFLSVSFLRSFGASARPLPAPGPVEPPRARGGPRRTPSALFSSFPGPRSSPELIFGGEFPLGDTG